MTGVFCFGLVFLCYNSNELVYVASAEYAGRPTFISVPKNQKSIWLTYMTRPGISQSVPEGPRFREAFCPQGEFKL